MANNKIKIGIIGCGTIGSQIAAAIEKRFFAQAELCALCDIDNNKAEKLKAATSSRPKILSAQALIALSELIIEAASAQVSYEVAREALGEGKDVMIMSVGGILAKAEQLFNIAESKGCHIYLPSGALGGLDAVKAAAMSKIEKVTLITRKPPQGLSGAPYLQERKIDLTSIKKETVVFAGTADEAIKGFPKNINICATLSLAGIGAKKTKVKIVSSPELKANIHEIQIEGDCGRLIARTENVPSPENPKTSFLAALSAIATLKNILGVVRIGT